MTLAITGSTGHVGRLVADQLGTAVDRLVVRDAARAPHLPGDPTVVVTTYGDREASVRALQGVDVLLMVSGAESPTRRDEHRTFIAAAAAAGVGHLVYTSFLGASPDALFTLGRDHFDAEQALRESGTTWTVLRDNFYTDVLVDFAGDTGVITGPAGDGLLSAVARADVADVATVVLRDVLGDPAAHAGATYELTGPEAFTLADATQRMTPLLGRPFSYVDEPLEAAYDSRRQWSQEQWQLEAWVSTYTAIRGGECAKVTGDVERLTGHPARSLEAALKPR